MAKYCTHCGKQISDDALFCRYCGAKAGTGGPAGPKPDHGGNNSNMKTIVMVAAIALVVALAAVGAFIHFGKDKQDTENVTETPAVTEEPAAEQPAEAPESVEEPAAEPEQPVEDTESSPESEIDNNYGFIIGESYVVQTNLRVRAGPGKEYRILNRNELTAEDYAKSVDSKTTTDALMEKGSVITCLDMYGKWMRISSGWVCVEDEGEVLVK